jgi:hypothetical protein
MAAIVSGGHRHAGRGLPAELRIEASAVSVTTVGPRSARARYGWMSFAAAGVVSAVTDGSGGRPSSASMPRTSPE